MSRYELGLSFSYVKNWGVQEALRELLQNALDSADEGYPIYVDYDVVNQILRIGNKGTALSKKTILLGESGKCEGQRGKYGEGYKLAILVLLREGLRPTIYNGESEIWRPKRIKSRKYGVDVPVIDIERGIFKKNSQCDVLYEIENITTEMYAEMLERTRFLQCGDNSKEVKTNKTVILLDTEQKGSIYVGGLFVCEEEGFEYGYDFSPSDVSLDRDRQMVKGFDIEWYSSRAWIQAVVEGKREYAELSKMLDNNTREVSYCGSMLASNSKAEKIITATAESFKAEYGEKAIPVTSQEDAENARSKGYTPVVVAYAKHYVLQHTQEYSAEVVAELQRDAQSDDLQEQLLQWLEDVANSLTDEQYNKGLELIDRIGELG